MFHAASLLTCAQKLAARVFFKSSARLWRCSSRSRSLLADCTILFFALGTVIRSKFLRVDYPWISRCNSHLESFRTDFLNSSYIRVTYGQIRVTQEHIRVHGNVVFHFFFIRHFHISHSADYLPAQILQKLCFSFLLGITAVLREIENNAYAKFWGASKVHYGKCGNDVWAMSDLLLSKRG